MNEWEDAFTADWRKVKKSRSWADNTLRGKFFEKLSAIFDRFPMTHSSESHILCLHILERLTIRIGLLKYHQNH